MANKQYIPRILTVDIASNSLFSKTIEYLKAQYKGHRVIIAYEIDPPIDPADQPFFDAPAKVDDLAVNEQYDLGIGASASKGKPTDPNGV